jgi:hypothetical protein
VSRKTFCSNPSGVPDENRGVGARGRASDYADQPVSPCHITDPCGLCRASPVGVRAGSGGAVGLERGRGADGTPGLVTGRFQGHVWGASSATLRSRTRAPAFGALGGGLRQGVHGAGGAVADDRGVYGFHGRFLRVRCLSDATLGSWVPWQRLGICRGGVMRAGGIYSAGA